MASRGFVICVLAFLVFGAALQFAGPAKVYGLWGFRVLDPPHEDARGITSAIEHLREGGKPWIENPRDPWGRAYNYPRIWLALGKAGMNSSHTALFAHILTILLFAGLLVFAPRDMRPAEALASLAVVFSPAVMLGVKAGNIDQAVFFLLAIAVPGLASDRPAGRAAGIAAVAAGFLLKIFPIFGLAACARFGRRNATLLLVAATLCVGIYTTSHWDEIHAIRRATPLGGSVSYGRDVLWMRVGNEFPSLMRAAQALTWMGAALGIALLPAGAALGERSGLMAIEEPKVVTAFLMGAAVFCGTFLLGNNWDYRLMFLTLTIPGLLRIRARSNKAGGVTAMAVLTAIIVACWNTGIWNALRHLPGGGPASVAIDQACKWLAFLGLMYLSGCHIPALLGSRNRGCR